MRRPHVAAGFTLIELLLATAITAVVLATVGSVFIGILQAREEVTAVNESSQSGPRIIALLERDLSGLWHHNVKDNRVLVGRNIDRSGPDADHIDFLTTTDAIGAVSDRNGNPRRPTICEVGYWLKPSDTDSRVLELYRREDPYVDDDLLQGGHFQLVHDRVLSFNITYYKTLGAKAEDVFEWDSSEEDSLPRRMKIELTVELPKASRNRVVGTEIRDIEGYKKTYVHHIVLDSRYPTILEPQVAMLPLLPPRPEEQAEAGGGGGGGESGGGGGGARGNGGQRTTQSNDSTRATRGGDQNITQNRGGDRGGNRGNTGFNIGDLFRGSNGNGNLFGR